MQHWRPLILLLALAFIVIAGHSLRAQTPQMYQASFGIETPIEKPYRVPRLVVKSIKSKMASPVESEFEGSLVDIGGGRKTGLLVQGDQGANVTGFWLFRKSRGKWLQILYTIAARLVIEKGKSKGFRNIRIAASSAVKLWESDYHFNGQRYLPFRCSEQDLSLQNPPKKFFPCTSSTMKPYR